jgi:hypothetical protein
MPVPAWSKVWDCGNSVAGIASSNLAGGMVVCRECCGLSDRGVCVGLITRPEESCRVWCV